MSNTNNTPTRTLPNEGLYRAVVVSGSLDRAGKDQKGTYQYVIKSRITERAVNGEDDKDGFESVDEFTRYIRLSFSDRANKITFDQLTRLGFDGKSFRDLKDWDPAGVEFLAWCKHEEYNGRTSDKWSVSKPPRPELADDDVEQLDNLFGAALAEYQQDRLNPSGMFDTVGANK